MIFRLLICLLLLPALLPGKLEAKEPTWLVLLVDVSDSVTADRYEIQKKAYVNVLTNPSVLEVLVRENVHIAIVEFAHKPTIISNFTSDYESLAQLYAAAPRGFAPANDNQYDGHGSYTFGLTAVERSLKFALDMLEPLSGRKVIDISADGDDNVTYRAITQKNRAIMNSVEVNVLLLPGNFSQERFVEAQEWYDREVVTGFLLVVERFEEIEKALERKFHLEVASNAQRRNHSSGLWRARLQ